MSFELPKKFQENTRWTYSQSGVEYGPFSATEILDLLKKREMSLDAVVTELESGRVCPVNDVRPFAEYIAILVERYKEEKADAELKEEADKLAGGKRRFAPILVVVSGVLAAGAAVVFLNPGLFGSAPKGSLESQKETKVEVVADVVTEADVVVAEAPELAIAEPESQEAVLERVARERALERAQQKHVVLPSAEGLTGRDVIAVEEAPELPQANVAKKGKNEDAEKKEGDASPVAGSGGAKVTTYDFTEEEDEGEERLASAKRRLTKSLRQCVDGMVRNHDDVSDVQVKMTAVLLLNGRIKKRSLSLNPARHASEVSICMATALPALSLPPLTDGKEETIHIMVRASQ